MIQNVRVAGLTFVLLAVGALARAEVTDCTAISSVPYVVTAPGVYCLKTSLHFAGTFHGAAITIQADDVVLDLNGHVLEGPGPEATTNTWGVRAVNRKNVTVRNGTIRAFLFGVSVQGGTASLAHVVEHLRLDANMDEALNVSGTGSIVRNNRVTRTGGPSDALNAGPHALGIYVFGNGAHVIDNEVVETVGVGSALAYGILVGGVGVVIERNVVSNSAASAAASYGIMVTGTRATVVANRVVHMTSGIYFYGGSNTGLSLDNTVGGATTPFTGGTPAGATNFTF
jgi:hypothetical protein